MLHPSAVSPTPASSASEPAVPTSFGGAIPSTAGDPPAVSNPPWWNGVCDSGVDSSYGVAGSWDGLVACGSDGPDYQTGGTFNLDDAPGSPTTEEWDWECPELSTRWLDEEFHLPILYANGYQVVDNYWAYITSHPSKTWPLTHVTPATATAGSLGPGDVLSFASVNGGPGHTDIVTSTSLNSSGTGYIYTLNENDGGFFYIPVTNWAFGVNDFDGNEQVATGWLHWTGGTPPAEHAPVASNDSVSDPSEATKTVDVLHNDTDADGDPLHVQDLTQPVHGFAYISVDDTVVYEPASGYSGSDSFSYRASDGMDSSNRATVTINGTAATVPGALTGVSGTAGDGQSTVSWTAPLQSGGSPILGYDVQCSASGGSTWTSASSAFHTSTATQQKVSGLTDGTPYLFHVAAINAQGMGAYSASSAAVTPNAVLTLAAASGATVGKSEKITGTLKRANGSSVANEVVRFFVQGANSATGSSTTNAQGVASISYTPLAAGEDDVQAYDDVNDDQVHEAGEPAAELTTNVQSTVIPTVSTVSPSSGPPTGGTSVTITGSGFTGATAVAFGGVAATNVAVKSGTKIVATAPAHPAGVTNVRVTAPGGQSVVVTPADQFTYVAVPVVSKVSPASGSPAGGTSVTITGSGFTGATAVAFGGVAASNVVVVSGTKTTASSPAHAAATTNVRVTGPGGQSAVVTPDDQFAYQVTVPKVTNLAPTSGPVAGGTSVTITGTAFTPTATATFGAGHPASSVTHVSSTELIVVSPPHPATKSYVSVTVTTAAGTSVAVTADHFTYA
jgi:hypothetical protein